MDAISWSRSGSRSPEKRSRRHSLKERPTFKRAPAICTCVKPRPPTGGGQSLERSFYRVLRLPAAVFFFAEDLCLAALLFRIAVGFLAGSGRLAALLFRDATAFFGGAGRLVALLFRLAAAFFAEAGFLAALPFAEGAAFLEAGFAAALVREDSGFLAGMGRLPCLTGAAAACFPEILALSLRPG